MPMTARAARMFGVKNPLVTRRFAEAGTGKDLARQRGYVYLAEAKQAIRRGDRVKALSLVKDGLFYCDTPGVGYLAVREQLEDLRKKIREAA